MVPPPKILTVGKNIPFLPLGIFISALESSRALRQSAQKSSPGQRLGSLNGLVKPQGKEGLTLSLSFLKKGHSKCFFCLA